MARRIVAGLLALLCPVVAQAAPAVDQEGADKLTALFERYVGHPPAGQAPSVTVLPQGTAYQATFNFKRAFAAFEHYGMTLDDASVSAQLTPREDGTWHVTYGAFPPVVLHVLSQGIAQTVTLASDTSSFDGIFDPRIPGFATATASQDGSTLNQVAPNMTQDRRYAKVTATQTATAGQDGSASVAIKYAISGLTSSLAAREALPPASPGENAAVVPQPSTTFAYSAQSALTEASIDKLRLRDLLEVWAFFVAHPDRDSIVAGQDELRNLLRGVLPVMAGLTETGSVDAISLTTAVGPFAARKLAAALDLKNLGALGEAAMAFSADGLVVPSGGIPPWSLDLIPTTIDIHPSVSGFHFDDAAREAVADFDLGAKVPFTPEQTEKIGRLALPGEGKVTLAPSRLTSNLLDLRMAGEATFGGNAPPNGRFTITGTGLDKAISALQAAAVSDEVAAQILPQFVAAKTLAKPNPDGSFEWVVEAAGNGPLTVNGVSLK